MSDNETTENPKVKLLVKSKNATNEDGFLRNEYELKMAQRILNNDEHGRIIFDPKNTNYTLDANGILIRQPSA